MDLTTLTTSTTAVVANVAAIVPLMPPEAADAVNELSAAAAVLDAKAHALALAYPVPPAVPPVVPPGNRWWVGDLMKADIGQLGSTFFAAGKSFWPVCSGVNGAAERISVAAAPDGTPSIRWHCPKGEVANANFSLDVFSIDHARAGCSVYIPPGFRWAHGQKLALGLWGGQLGALSGGAERAKQTGFSVRLVHSPSQGALLYSYHLNRSTSNISGAGDFGQGIGAHTGPLPQGRWIRLEIDLRLNTPGKADGKVWLLMDGKVIAAVGNLIYRRDASWHIRGPILHEMWGGNTDAPQNLSLADQAYWYSDYRYEERT